MSKKSNKKQNSDNQVVEEKAQNQQASLSNEAELLADVQRIQAEFVNFKKRSEDEKATLSQFSKAQVIKDLLPVVDDLERALEHLPKHLSEDKWAQGAAKVYARLKKQLEKLGVTEIEALNQNFDPNLHEAVQADGEGEHQVVSEVLQTGYKLGDMVIRHSVVKVMNQ